MARGLNCGADTVVCPYAAHSIFIVGRVTPCRQTLCFNRADNWVKEKR